MLHDCQCLTDHHDVEVETFPNTFSMPLVGQICKPNIARKLSPDHISQITRGLCGSFGILRADGLRGDLSTRADGIGTFTVRGGGLSIRHRRA